MTRRTPGRSTMRPQNPRLIPWVVATVCKLTRDPRPHVRLAVRGSVAERIDEAVRWAA